MWRKNVAKLDLEKVYVNQINRSCISRQYEKGIPNRCIYLQMYYNCHWLLQLPLVIAIELVV